MFWREKRVLVTGGGGFIGSHLTERLVREGARVRVLTQYNSLGSWEWLDVSPVRDEIEVILGDVRDRDSVRHAMNDAETVFHLAALIAIPYSYHAPLSYVRTNVEGTLNVLQAARERGVERFVHTSTSETYGTAQYAPIDESHPSQAQSPYAASKIGADKIAESFYMSFGLPVVTVRPFNTYGPRQSARAVIPTIIVQCLDGKSVKLGNLEPTRDLTYVTDTVDGFIRAAESDKAVGATINIGSGQEISIGDLARKIISITEPTVSVEIEPQRVRPKTSEVTRLVADVSKARDLFGWEPTVSLDEGLTKTIEWMRHNIDRYRPEMYTV